MSDLNRKLVFYSFSLEYVLKQFHKISVIGLLALVIGIITVGPAMADKDSSEGSNKINICHFDKGDKKYVEKSVPEKKAKGHAKNHVNDIIPAPEEGCPVREEPEIETETDDGIDMEFLIEDVAKHHEIVNQITNSECTLGEVVTGFGPNGEILCSPDDTGDANSFNIISRSDTAEIPIGERLIKEYYCESGEIILGGSIEMPSMDDPLSNDGNIISSTEQSYNIVTGTNKTPESIKVIVTYLCYDAI